MLRLPSRLPRLRIVWMRLLTVLLLSATAAAYGHAQTLPRLTGLPTQQTLQHWTKRDGLPQNYVQSLAQTPDGFVWIGTIEGLLRFDGTTFTLYRHTDTPGLPGSQINVLRTTRNGRLWIGTTEGIGSFMGGRFAPAIKLPGVDSPDVQDIAEAPDGTIWVGSILGLFRYNGTAFQRYGPSEGLDDDRVLALSFAPDGTLYVGTPSGLFAGQRGRFARHGNSDDIGLVRSLHTAPNGRVYVGSASGLMEAIGSDVVPVDLPGRAECAPVRSIHTDVHGALWVGTRTNGVCTILDGRFISTTPAQGLPVGDTRAFLNDTERGLWVGAEGGLARLRRGPFATYGEFEGLPGHGTSVVFQDSRNRLWLGTQDGGFVRFGPDGRRTFGEAQGLPALSASAIAEHGGRVWVGVHDGDNRGGLCTLNAADTGFSCVSHPPSPDLDFIFALLSTNGTLLAGTRTGVARWTGQRLELLADSTAGLHGQMVVALVQTRDGSIWAGSNGGGIVRFLGGDLARPRPYAHTDGLTGMGVVTLQQDERGDLWAGLTSGQICRYRDTNDRWACYSAEHGLSGGQIMQLLPDQRGNLWVGTNFGYERLRIEEADQIDAGMLRRFKLEPMGLNEYTGLRDPEATGGLQPSAWRLSDGRLAFSTVGGLGLYESDEAPRFTNRVPPPVHLAKVRTNRSEIATDSRLHTLPVGERDLHVTVSVVAFTYPDAVSIRYRLEGYDDTWQTLDKGVRMISYTSLPPGSYRLHVQAANADGVWNTDGASLHFQIPPRFYETSGFRALMLVLALLLVAMGVRWRLQSLVARQQELEQMVDERTAELLQSQTELLAREDELEQVNASLEAEVKRQVEDRMEERKRYEEELIEARDKAEASARLKETILNNMSHEIRTPITAILGFAEVLEHEVEGDAQEFVRYIDENGKRLLTTLNTVLDFSYLESEGMHIQPTAFDAIPVLDRAVRTFEPLAQRNGLTVELIAPDKLPITTDFFGFERILTNLVGNAIKFTSSGGVRVSLDATDEQLTFTVTDSGMGIDPAFLPDLYTPFKQESGGLSRQHEGTGLGLTIVKRFVDALGGTIECHTEKGRGTTFTVGLPRHLLMASGDGATGTEPVPQAHV